MCDIPAPKIKMDDKTNNLSLETTISSTEYKDENINIEGEGFNDKNKKFELTFLNNSPFQNEVNISDELKGDIYSHYYVCKNNSLNSSKEENELKNNENEKKSNENKENNSNENKIPLFATTKIDSYPKGKDNQTARHTKKSKDDCLQKNIN